MKMYIKLAWRNIWRNKRRTLLTTGSIVVAIVLAVFTRSLQNGTFDNMVKSITETYTGHIQIHKLGYWNDKTVDHIFLVNDTLQQIVQTTPGVRASIPRFESFALASSEKLTKGVMVMGIHPSIEDSLTHIARKMVEGIYLTDSDTALIIGRKLAGYLKVKVNDTLVLISQGYHGVSAAGKYPVKGIIKNPNPELDRQIIYMPLALCQEFYSAPNMISSLAILIDKPSLLTQAYEALSKSIDAQRYEVMTWEDVFPELVQHIKLDTSAAYIMFGILYIIVGFGIFGTITMMTIERTREFAIMIAVGMKKRILAGILAVETLMIGLLGAALGVVFSIPVIAYFYYKPIRITGEMAKTMEEFGIDPLMYISVKSSFFVNHSLLVFGIACCCAIFPVISVFKMKVMESLRK